MKPKAMPKGIDKAQWDLREELVQGDWVWKEESSDFKQIAKKVLLLYDISWTYGALADILCTQVDVSVVYTVV